MTNLIGNGCVVHLPSLEKELAQMDGTDIAWKGIINEIHFVWFLFLSFFFFFF